MSVAVPVIAFAQTVRVVRGRLRTPVLLTDPRLNGVASVPGARGCRVRLAPGVAAWLDCSVSAVHPPRVVVTLSDGTRLAHAVLGG
jgi:hypothetical protein